MKSSTIPSLARAPTIIEKLLDYNNINLENTT